MQLTNEVEKKETCRKRWPELWVIVLLAFGSPIWLPLGIAAVTMLFSFYVSLWAAIVSLWAAFGSLAGCSLGGVLAGVTLACCGKVLPGWAMLGGGMVCAGLSVFLFYGCKAATAGVLILTKKIGEWVRKLFNRGGEAQ